MKNGRIIPINRIHLMLWLVMGIISGGCGAQSIQQTQVMAHEAIGTQVAYLQVSSTAEVARLAITVDYYTTQVALAATQSQFLKATLVDQGTPLPYLNELQATRLQRPAAVIPSDTPNVSASPSAVGDGSENDSGDAAIAPPTLAPSPIITPAAALTAGALTAIAQATPQPNVIVSANNTLPAFVSDIRLGESVGSDDCVSQNVATFRTNTPEIYISARIRSAPANTQFQTQWIAPDGNSVTFDYTPDFSIDDACIWFYIDQSDLMFDAGDWTVNFRVNGESQSSRYDFSIIE